MNADEIEVNNDNFFIKTGFFNLKDNKFLAKDISATLRKNLFGVIMKMIQELKGFSN